MIASDTMWTANISGSHCRQMPCGANIVVSKKCLMRSHIVRCPPPVYYRNSDAELLGTVTDYRPDTTSGRHQKNRAYRAVFAFHHMQSSHRSQLGSAVWGNGTLCMGGPALHPPNRSLVNHKPDSIAQVELRVFARDGRLKPCASG